MSEMTFQHGFFEDFLFGLNQTPKYYIYNKYNEF